MMAILHARTFASGKLQHASLQYSNQSRSSTVDKHGCPETIEAPSPTQSASSPIIVRTHGCCQSISGYAHQGHSLQGSLIHWTPRATSTVLPGWTSFAVQGCHSKQKILCPFPMGLWAPQNLLVESIQALLSTFVFLIPNNLHHHRMPDIQGWDPLPGH